MGVITISKDCGTSSCDVAQQAAARLGYAYVGKALIAEIAEKLKLSESEAEFVRKTSQSRIHRFFNRSVCTTIQKVVDREKGCLDDTLYNECTRKLVEDLYAAGDVIILGWGGQCILQGRPDTLHVRLTKADDAKVRAVMEKRNLTSKAAREYIKRMENESRGYVKHFFDEDWDNVRLYDLVIDMGRTTVNHAADLICKGMDHKMSY